MCSYLLYMHFGFIAIEFRKKGVLPKASGKGGIWRKSEMRPRAGDLEKSFKGELTKGRGGFLVMVELGEQRSQARLLLDVRALKLNYSTSGTHPTDHT